MPHGEITLTHHNFDWEYTCCLLNGVVTISLQETQGDITVDYLMYHEANKEFRQAVSAKAEPHHGPHPLQHMLRLEVADMRHGNPDQLEAYTNYSLLAKEWAHKLCGVDFAEKMRRGNTGASWHTNVTGIAHPTEILSACVWQPPCNPGDTLVKPCGECMAAWARLGDAK